MPPLKIIISDQQAIDSRKEKQNARSGSLEVDFDKDVTKLYESISQSNWAEAIEAVRKNPSEAKTWVVKHSPEGEVMWRFLPLHSACARQPPTSLVRTLLEANPEASKEADDQGMHALHYACGNQASPEVIRVLLLSNNEASLYRCKPNGMTPLHYVCQWGPSSLRVLDILLFSNSKMLKYTDNNGYTALELLADVNYSGKDDVKQIIEQFLEDCNEDIAESQKSVNEAVKSMEKLKLASPPTLSSSIKSDSIVKQITKNDNKVVNSLALIGTQDKEQQPAVANKKTLAKLRAEVNKLRAEAEFTKLELEEKITNDRLAQAKIESDLQNDLDAAIEETHEAQAQMIEKKEFAKYVESRFDAKSKELDQVKADCSGLETELFTVTEVADEYKVRTERLDKKVKEFESVLANMVSQQDKLYQEIVTQEEYIQRAQKMRILKLQELIAEEEDAIKDREAKGLVVMENSTTKITFDKVLDGQKKLLDRLSDTVQNP